VRRRSGDWLWRCRRTSGSIYRARGGEAEAVCVRVERRSAWQFHAYGLRAVRQLADIRGANWWRRRESKRRRPDARNPLRDANFPRIRLHRPRKLDPAVSCLVPLRTAPTRRLMATMWQREPHLVAMTDKRGSCRLSPASPGFSDQPRNAARAARLCNPPSAQGMPVAATKSTASPREGWRRPRLSGPPQLGRRHADEALPGAGAGLR